MAQILQDRNLWQVMKGVLNDFTIKGGPQWLF